MRTTDPSLIAQAVFGAHSGGSKYQAVQHQGVYVGEVVDTHTNNNQVPKGTLRFIIPSFNGNSGWVPAPFPGSVDPPIGAQCVVAFEGTFGNAPRVIAFTDWQSPRITVSETDPTLDYSPTTGDLWIQP